MKVAWGKFGVAGLGLLAMTFTSPPASANSAFQTVIGEDAGAQRHIDHHHATVANAEIQVFLAGGSLDVQAGDVDEIRLRGSLGAGLSGVEVHHAGRFSRLRVEPTDRRPLGDPTQRRAALVLTVPPSSDLRIDAASSSIAVDGLTGRLEILSLDGEVTIRGAPRSITAETVSGDIDINVVSPRLIASSVSGALKIDGRIESLRAETVEGRLDIAARVDLEADVATVTSELSWRGELGPQLRLRASTGSGAMDLQLAPDLEAVVDIEGLLGGLDNAVGPSFAAGTEQRRVRFFTGQPTQTNSDAPPRALPQLDALNNPGPTLHLRTLGGAISLQTQP